MTVLAPRLFADVSEIVRIGEGLLTKTLPKSDWTHEAHLAACIWILACRTDIDARSQMPGFIRGYNRSVGGINDEQQGYHETITQAYIRLVEAYVANVSDDQSLTETVNNFLQSACGSREWLFTFYSKERLFSNEARRIFLEPDIRPFEDRG